MVGLVGLGNMGSALADRLLTSVPLVGADADPQARERARRAGVEVLADAAAVGARAEIVLLSLPRPEVSRAVLEVLLAAMRPGGLVIETSTVLPDDARAMHALAVAAGVGFVDAAILSGVGEVAEGTSCFLIGGEDEDVARAEPTLRAICERTMRLGPPGAGMAAKVVNNAVAHAEMVVLVEAAALARAEGIGLPTLCALLDQEDAGVKRPLSARLAGRVVEGRYDGGMPTEAARKDSALALEMARAAGVPLFAIKAADEVYELALERGLARDDYAAIAQLWLGPGMD